MQMSRPGLVLRGHCISQETNRLTGMTLQAIPGVRKGCELPHLLGLRRALLAAVMA